MRSEEFKTYLFEATDFFISIAEVNQSIEVNEQHKSVLADFIKMITSLRDNALKEYIYAETSGDINAINYLQKFLQRLTNLVTIAKSTNDNQKLMPAIQELINLATTSENHTNRPGASISVLGIIGGIVGFTLGFIVGVPLGLLVGAFFYSIPIIDLGSIFPMIMIGYWVGCGLLGGLTLGAVGAQTFYEACSRNTIESFNPNPLLKFKKQIAKTFDKDIFCRLFRSKVESKEEDAKHHAETPTKQLAVSGLSSCS